MSDDIEGDLVEWARVYLDRDRRVRRAYAAGVTKHRIHTLTGISRPTIDRLLTKGTTIVATVSVPTEAVEAATATDELR